jgi:enoyl-CoA hydratase
MHDNPHVLIAEEDGILILTLNRPEKYNALSVAMMRTSRMRSIISATRHHSR